MILFRKINSVIVWLLTLTEGTFVPRAERSVGFNDLKRGWRLASEAPWEVVWGVNQLVCASMCLGHPKCLSYNFCGVGTCELNSWDIFSEDVVWEEDNECIYAGMSLAEFPLCKEGGVLRSIQDDNIPNICKINKKRQDAEWGAWGLLVEVENSSEFREVNKGECREPKHGGVDNCIGKDKQIITWYRFFHRVNWDNANVECQGIGGKLFDNLDGTKGQLDFILDITSNTSFWLGIEKSSSGAWIKLDGSSVPNSTILWDVEWGEPSMVSAESVLMCYVFKSSRRYIHNVVPTSVSETAVCDMLNH